MNTEHIDKELTILENIYYKSDRIRQRDLAHVAGISLGMTNAILKRLVTKGLLIAKKINRRTIHYAVTPAGITKIINRSYGFFKKTISNIVFYKDKIRELIHSLSEKGYKKIVFIGESDLDFIFEYCSRQEGLSFEKTCSETQKTHDDETCLILSEKIRAGKSAGKPMRVSLFDFIRRINSEKIFE